ncbi:unnamed protein product [Paramecium pentaurelia]|uniref:Uncharacterized protein n=1 Tax=Paramecium pentaurelia TaxID=43138 RepID=A0A8S1XWB0_9CILI|nr:unnamed protein product [Paramecium pentaurelia]
MQSLSHLESRLSSLQDFNKIKDPQSVLEEEFNKQETLKKQINDQNSQFNLIFQEIRNNNIYKQRIYQKLIKHEMEIKPIILDKVDQHLQTISKFDESQSISSLETTKQLQISIDELIKSINKKKQQIYPMEHQMQLLKYQQKQAEDELILAEFEMLRSKQLLQSMKTKIQRLQSRRNQYLQELMDQNDLHKANTEEQKKEYQVIQDHINELKIQIHDQKLQIEDLKQQERFKWESSGNQMIIIKNYLAMTKLYEFCTNQIQKIDISQDSKNENDESEDLIIESSENSFLDDGGVFQTQIKQTSLKSKQSIKSINSIKKNQKKAINYQQSLQNFITAKELISQVKLNVDINIIEEIILKAYEEQSNLQRQLAEQHTFLIEQKGECIKEYNNIQQKFQLDDGNNKERIIKCSRPSNDNFNQNVITSNIALSSVTNKLKIIQTISRRQQMEDLFLCMNNRASIFLQRIINILHNIAQRSEIANQDMIEKYQQAQMTLMFVKQNQQQLQMNLDDYPEFKKLKKSHNITLLYNDNQIFNEFKQYCQQITENEIDDKVLSENFDAFVQLCLNRIASESQCIYEQIAIICNQIKIETQQLRHFCHISSTEQIPLPHIVQMTYNMAAEKLQNYTDSKISDPNITTKRKQLARRSLLLDERNSQQGETNEENYEKYYSQIKNGIENPQIKRDIQTDSTMVAKTSLLYDNYTPRTEFIKQNRQLTLSLNRIQSLSHIYHQINNQEFSNNFKHNIHREQKTIQYLTNHSTQTRPGSNSLAMMSTYRQECRTEHNINNDKSKTFKQTKSKSQISKVILNEAKKQMQKIKTINKLQFNQ